MVANTLAKLSDDRRCFRKIGDNLVEKDLGSIKKDLNIEIANKTMIQQESIINEYEKKYNDIIAPALKKKLDKQDDEKNKKTSDGVLV